jgi:hypothetical protein
MIGTIQKAFDLAKREHCNFHADAMDVAVTDQTDHEPVCCAG